MEFRLKECNGMAMTLPAYLSQQELVSQDRRIGNPSAATGLFNPKDGSLEIGKRRFSQERTTSRAGFHLPVKMAAGEATPVGFISNVKTPGSSRRNCSSRERSSASASMLHPPTPPLGVDDRLHAPSPKLDAAILARRHGLDSTSEIIGRDDVPDMPARGTCR